MSQFNGLLYFKRALRHVYLCKTFSTLFTCILIGLKINTWYNLFSSVLNAGAAEDPISRAQYSQNGCFNLVANSSPSNQDCSMTVPDSIVKRKQSFMTSAEKYVSELQGFGINDGVIEQDHAKCYPFHSMQPNRMGHYF